TIGYMAPEQVRGEAVDHRADIFAFGAVLYETLAGQRAFAGASSVEGMNAILKEEPAELSEINRQGNPRLARIVNHCLEKNPERRFQSAIDLAFALEALSNLSGAASASTPLLVTQKRNRERRVWLGAGLLLGLLALLPFTIAYFRRAPVETQTTRAYILPPEKLTVITIAVSPDGRRLAFTARDAANKTLVWVRPLDSLTAKPLPDTEGATLPFWSPDSRLIGFFAQGRLKKIDASGGPAEAL